MKNTEGDVWEMIWMEKCAAVVVLCDFVEGKDVSKQCTHYTDTNNLKYRHFEHSA